MSTESARTLTGAALAPSELCYLFGTQFAGRGGSPNPAPHLPDDKEADIGKLATTLVAAALLADEQVGALHLEVRQTKALLGLRKVNRVFAIAAAEPPAFSEGSWELRLHERLTRQKERTEQVRDSVYQIVPESSSPFGEVVGLVLSGLNRRGLLDVIDTRRLKIFHSKRYQLKESTASLAAQQPLDPVKTLLQTSEQTRPELHKLLLDDIHAGISRAQKVEDSGGPD